MKITHNQPSTRWGEALPLGNGHMGAMVYGSMPGNRIELTENTFFSGNKSDHNNRKNASKAFYKMRDLASRGKFDEVHKAAENFIGKRNNYGTNLPVGCLIVDTGADFKNVSGYVRSLDIMNGIAVQSYRKDGFEYKEEQFLSNPDHIMVHHLCMDERDTVTISFHPANEYGEVIYTDGSILFTCYAYETLHCDEICGVLLQGFARIITDGTCRSSKDRIIISNASDIKIFLDMETDFKRDFVSQEDAVKALKEEVVKHVTECTLMNYETLKEQHLKDFRSYMERVEIQLEEKDEYTKLVPTLFQYGRYLLLSSSREDSKLPAHLQGIWNDNVACRIGWTCDMHLDINTQMNYWPSEVTNLNETAKPLFEWIAKDLAVEGTIAAKNNYGLNGWVGELVSNAWGFAAPYWASPIAPCPTGGVWILMQLWEHYLYSEDIEFLEHELYPLLEAAVKFFDQYLFKEEDSEYYTCGPSISPENSFLYQDRPYQISNGCTYEILMIRELFMVYLTTCDLIHPKTSELQRGVQDKLQHLLPYRITTAGTIAEWSHDLEQADVQHRHTSHLLGLYPFSQITPEETPELCLAAKNTLETKLNPPDNWEDTGWARSMLMLYEARLQDGKAAYEHIKCMMDKLLEPNCMVYHPPTRGAGAFDHVYELDGNTGLTTCIAELLLQSHLGILRLLPALPEDWETGVFKGLRARGNITVDLTWEKGKLREAKLISGKDQTCRISYNRCLYEIELKKEIPYLFEGSDIGMVEKRK